jgi:hypothetical protein
MGLQLATGGHIGVLCIHYRNYTIIKLLPLIFFHVGPANQPTTVIVALCHKKFGHPWICRSTTCVNLYTIYNGPTNALVCNKTLIHMSHTKTLKITPTCFDHHMIIIRELFDPG